MRVIFSPVQEEIMPLYTEADRGKWKPTGRYVVVSLEGRKYPIGRIIDEYAEWPNAFTPKMKKWRLSGGLVDRYGGHRFSGPHLQMVQEYVTEQEGIYGPQWA